MLFDIAREFLEPKLNHREIIRTKVMNERTFRKKAHT